MADGGVFSVCFHLKYIYMFVIKIIQLIIIPFSPSLGMAARSSMNKFYPSEKIHSAQK